MEKPFKRKYLVEKEKKKKVAILMHVTEAGKTPCPKDGGQEEFPRSEVRAAAESARLQQHRSSCEELPPT